MRISRRGWIPCIVSVGLLAACGEAPEDLHFDLPIRGSLVELAVGTLPFLAAMLSVGLLVSSISRSGLSSRWRS
jgi:hypothetical protein